MNSNFVFKILEYKEWFNKEEEYKGSLIDLKDGFIHLSSAAQLNATLSLYFAKEESVVLLQVDHSQTHDRIKFEAPIPTGNRSGLFPHYYGDLNIDAVSQVWHLKRSAFEMPIEVVLQAEQGANS